MLFGMFDGWPEALLLRPSGEWLESFWANDVPVQPALAPGEIFGDEQARANGYVIELDHPELGTDRDGRARRSPSPADAGAHVAPDLGAHTDEVLDEWQPRARPRQAPTGPVPRTRWKA